MKLNYAGAAIAEAISGIWPGYRGVSVDCSVVMPNHVHMLVGLRKASLGSERRLTAQRACDRNCIRTQQPSSPK